MQLLRSDLARPRRSLLTTATLLALAAAPAAFAEGATAAAGGADDAVSNLDAVLVTGSRASNRTVANSAVPIDVVSSNEIVATGKSNLLEALQVLLPSLSQQARQSDVEGNIPGAQLRNLPPGYTLVLINGKRRNTSAYASVGTFPGQSWTDLSLIPVSAIERVEVLRDGASAIYGSDAIAGVFNIILKTSPDAGSASLELGTSYEGDGDRLIATFNHGFALGERGFLNLTAEYTDKNTPSAASSTATPTFPTRRSTPAATRSSWASTTACRPAPPPIRPKPPATATPRTTRAWPNSPPWRWPRTGTPASPRPSTSTASPPTPRARRRSCRTIACRPPSSPATRGCCPCIRTGSPLD
ncbi:TonB-dependent receptor plug domain-containing protein [Pseudoxanthomonas sp. NC8]|nr:TonB-dependent receptor plug domain-containing protein [Pseudoxanthomonas sp. NC8]